jgi:ribosomal-protein-alanine N-acetyltransferase
MAATDNAPSLKLLTAIGFTQEGLLREHYYSNDRLYDSVLFSLLKREYVSK